MKKSSDLLVLLVYRFVSPTPKFFKKLRNVSAGLGLVSVCLAYLQSKGVVVPYADIVGNGVVTASSFVAALIAQLTKEDAPAEPK